MIIITLLMTAALTFAAPTTTTTTEYYVVEDVAPFDAETDVVTVVNARGDALAYYADVCSVMGGDVVSVTTNVNGEIISATVKGR